MLILFVFLFSCKTTKVKKAAIQYEYMHFERLGDKQIDMRIYPSDNRGRLKIMISSIDYQTIDKSVELTVSARTAEAYDEFYHALAGHTNLNEKGEKLKKKTSSFLQFHFYQGYKAYTVTSPLLMERFQIFEEAVRATFFK